MTTEKNRRIDDARPAVGLEWDESAPKPARAAFEIPNRWTILLTSSNHGLVGAYGHDFPHATSDHLKVNVIAQSETSPRVVSDGWMVDGSLIYRLNDDGANCDEINVTMVSGSRDPGVRHDAAVELLADLQRAPASADNPSTANDEIDELRQRVAGLEAARMAYASEFPPVFGEPDVGSIHANIRALKAKLSDNPSTAGAGVNCLKSYNSIVGERCYRAEDVERLLAAPVAQSTAGAAKLTEEEIQTIWQTMPGGPAGWLKSFGYLQFARAVEEWIIENGGPLAAPALNPSEVRVAELEAEVKRLNERLKKKHAAHFLASQALHNTLVGNQAAWIEWQHGAGAEAAMTWIHNGLAGPGLIPDGKEAQPWFDANEDDRYDIPPMAPAAINGADQ